MKIVAPIQVEMKVSITDGNVQGVATIGFTAGCFPTEVDMREVLDKFERENMLEGFRLMTKREWWDTICPPRHEEDYEGEIRVVRFAMPGGKDYDIEDNDAHETAQRLTGDGFKIWEAEDIRPGRRYSKQHIKEIWLIGYRADADDYEARYVSVSESDGMVTKPYTKEELAAILSEGGYVPINFL
jgi:hypothetical protein